MTVVRLVVVYSTDYRLSCRFVYRTSVNLRVIVVVSSTSCPPSLRGLLGDSLTLCSGCSISSLLMVTSGSID